jgi:hypothetical protein
MRYPWKPKQDGLVVIQTMMDRSALRALKRFCFLALSLVLLPFVWNRANNDWDKAPFSVAVEIVLFLTCLGQSVVYSGLRNGNDKLERKVQELERKLELETQEIRRKLELEIQECKRKLKAAESHLVIDRALAHTVRDDDNHYTLIKVFAHIDGEGNYNGQYERHGTNHSRAIDHIRVLTCSDSALEFDQLRVQAFDLNSNGAKLKVVVREDNPRQKLFDICFKRPVQPNEPFGVGWSFLWPRVMRTTDDHDYIMLKDFQGGVEKLSYTLEFEREIPSFRFEEVKDGKLTALAGGKEVQQGKLYSYTIELQNPKGEAYMFSYL